MYIGSTAPERAARFLVLQQSDTPKEVQQYIQDHQIKNLILDGQHCDIFNSQSNDFIEIFKDMEIVHLANLSIKNSAFLYQFQQVRRLEIKHCKFTGRESIDWQRLPKLQELFTRYSPRFEHLFDHPQLNCLFLENFTVEGFQFPQNNQIKTLALEKSAPCEWATLRNFPNLIALYLVNIKSLQDISWLKHLKNLQDIELSRCKNAKQVMQNLAELPQLETIYLSEMGNFDCLLPLQRLRQLKEFTIENGGKLQNPEVKFLKQMQGLEFSIEMSNATFSNDYI